MGNDIEACSCGADYASTHKANCGAYALAVAEGGTPSMACTPNGFVWALSDGLTFLEREGAVPIESPAHIGQYLSNLEEQARIGNLPASLDEITFPVGVDRGALTYGTTQANDGFASVACVIVSFSLPRLTSAMPDVLFSVGTAPPGFPEPTAFSGEQVATPADLPSVQTLASEPGRKYRFVLWGAQQSFARTAITNWFLQAPTRNGFVVPNRRLKFVMSAVALSTFKVEMVHVGGMYYRLLMRLCALLAHQGRNGSISLSDLNTLLSSPQALVQRRAILTALIDTGMNNRGGR